MLADQWGVRSESIAAWELGRSRPGIRQLARIIALLGTDLMPVSETLAGRLTAARRRLGLTQAELAARLGQDEAQISRWERGRRTPHPAIAGRVDLALRALEGRPAGEGSESPSYFDLTRWRRRPSPGVSVQPATFGERLRARRLDLGLSATFVARQAGTSRGTLYRIERGCQAARPSLERRLKALLYPNGAP